MVRFWRPILPGRHIRMLYVAEDLFLEINSGGSDAYRMGQLQRDFDVFCQGPLITVGYGRESTCFMKPLEPIEDEVWEIRSRDPEPQVRVFGRFLLPDTFIATNAEFRDQLGEPGRSKWDGNNWPAEILRCKRRWEVFLPAQKPFSGDSVHEYITSGAVEVGNLP